MAGESLPLGRAMIIHHYVAKGVQDDAQLAGGAEPPRWMRAGPAWRAASVRGSCRFGAADGAVAALPGARLALYGTS